jgi:tetratricopeptide (TPR) repeat protein
MHQPSADEPWIRAALAAGMPQACARLLRIGERDLRRAGRFAERASKTPLPEQPRERAWIRLTLGLVLLRWERAAQARVLLEQAARDFTALQLPAAALHARRGLLIADRMHGATPELVEQYALLADAYEQLPNLLEAARTRFEQTAALNLLGRTNEALALIACLTPIVDQSGALPDRARLARLEAVARTIDGELDAADAAYERAATLYNQAGYVVEATKTENEWSAVIIERERFDAALVILERLRVRFSRLQMPLWVAFCEKRLAVAYLGLGHFAEAFVAIRRAIGAFQRLGRQDHQIDCELVLGNVAYYSGLFDIARATYLRVAANADRMDWQQLMLQGRRNAAMALLGLQQFAAALTELDQVEALAVAHNAQLELAEIFLARGRVLAGLERIIEATDQIEQAARRFHELGNQPAVAECRLEQGWLHLRQSSLDAARTFLEPIRNQLVDRPLQLWRVLYGLGRCAEAEGNPRAALQAYRRAIGLLAGLRRGLSSPYASGGLARLAQALGFDAVRCAAHLGAPETVLELAEQSQAVALAQQLRSRPFVLPPNLQAEYEQRRNRIQLETGNLEALGAYLDLVLQARSFVVPEEPVAGAQLDLTLFRQAADAAFPAGWTVLAFVHAGDRLIRVVCDSESLELDEVVLDASLRTRLERAILPHFRPAVFLGAAKSSGQPGSVWPDLERLGERLIPAAVCQRLHPDHRLLIVATGALQSLAWPALRVDNEWLVQRATIQLLPGLQSWLTLRARPRPGREALVIGISEFHGQLSDLPQAAAVLEEVVRAWPGPALRLVNAQATRARLLELARSGALQQYGLLHIETHGRLVESSGLLSHLQFDDDQMLYDELSGLNLAGALVVLGSCEGAAGEVLAGDEVLSLNRALLAGGARDVVAGQWQFYDELAPHLLRAFYTAIAAGTDAPTALAHAQRAMIEAANPDRHITARLRTPLFWAGFSAFGAGTATP